MEVKELESKNQQIYELQREISRLTALERDYISEIELQNDETKKLEAKIQQLEKDNVLIKRSKKEQVDSLENEVTEKSNEIKKLTEELKTIAKLEDSVNIDSSKYDALLQEISALKQENTLLNHLSIEIKNNFDVATKYNSDLEVKVKDLQEELDSMRKNCALKNEKLQEANSLIESLKEDLIVTQSQLEITTNKPLDDLCRGNSLFAEVDDRRVKLQTNMSQMKDHYFEMKKKHVALLDHVSFLKKENVTLQERLTGILHLQDVTANETFTNYNSRIETLEALVSKYQDMAEEKPIREEEDVFTFEKAIAAKNEEIEGFMKQVDNLSAVKTLQSFRLSKTNKELEDSKLNLSKLECDIAEFKVQIENLTMNKPELVKKAPCSECAKRKTQFVNQVKSKTKPRQVQNNIIEYDLNILMQKPKNNIKNEALGITVASSKDENILDKEEMLPNTKLNTVEELFKGNQHIIVIDEEKENDKFNATKLQEKKSVKFTDNTFTPKTDNKSYRRKGKFINFPVTHVPNCE